MNLNQYQDLVTEMVQHLLDYEEARPSISDAEYDRKLALLREFEARHPDLVSPRSPTQTVGRSSRGWAKFKHRVPMLSLANAFSPEELTRHFASSGVPERTRLVVEPKVDGLSLSLHYRDGQLLRAVTRGDKEYGDVVTANARFVSGVPTKVTPGTEMEVRGEVYMPKASFEALNARQAELGEEPFANARNAAAGSLKQKNAVVTKERGLCFIAYQVIVYENGNARFPVDHTKGLEMAEMLGFKTPAADSRWIDLSLDQVISVVTELHSLRAQLPYDTDGLVFKVCDGDLRDQVGLGSTSPKWAFAYKFPAERMTTTLLGITLTVGRTGQITPNAVLKPISIGGTTVKAASLCNADEIQRLNVNVGDEVLVEKSGEIIPKVVGLSGTKKSTGFWSMPVVCPSCQAALERVKVHYFCTNAQCPERVRRSLTYALSKPALDWDGFGPAMADRFIETGLSTLSAILQADDGQLITALKTDSAVRKFKENRSKILAAPLYRKYLALGIEGVGVSTAKDLAEAYPAIETLAEAAGSGALADVVGPVCADSIKNWLELNLDEVAQLDNLGFKFESQASSTPTGPLSGLTFVLTGAMASGTRPQVSDRIEKAGGKVKGSVTKDVNYLVVGEGGGGGKDAAAKKHGTARITEEDLYRMMGIDMPVATDSVLIDGEPVSLRQ